MKSVSYDPSAHVYSVDLADGAVARTVKLDDARLVDLDEGGNVLSVEILDPENPGWDEIAERFSLAGQLSEILQMVEYAVPKDPPASTSRSAYISFVQPEVSYAEISFLRVGIGVAQSVPSAPARSLTLIPG